MQFAPARESQPSCNIFRKIREHAFSLGPSDRFAGGAVLSRCPAPFPLLRQQRLRAAVGRHRGNLAPLPGPDHRLHQPKSVTQFTAKICPGLGGTHSANPSVGGFAIHGDATVEGSASCKKVKYHLAYIWNDIIDPNPQYSNDTKYAKWARMFFNPKDYEIHIHWKADSEIDFGDGKITSESGWPFTF